MGKNGETRDTMVRAAPLPKQADIAAEIQTGRYKVVYDNNGLQTASATNSNPDSTWYAFDVQNAESKTIGEYHIHPCASSKRNPTGFASGNLKVPSGSSGMKACIGRATDWQWLCDKVYKSV